MKLSPAFTLIEILVVVSLIGLLSLGGVTAFITAKNNQDLSQSTDHVVDTIRRAHIFSRDGREEKEWGVQSTDNDQYMIVSRSLPEDVPQVVVTYSLPSSVHFSAPFLVWFGKGTGEIEAPFIETIENTNKQKTTLRVEKTGMVSFGAE
jgi:prepilin-type N-terminal cleavage/methylation domain-containing protein